MLNIHDEGVKDSLDTIFGAMLVWNTKQTPELASIVEKKSPIARQLVHSFKSIFTANIFREEYAVFYNLITKNRGYSFTENNFKLVIDSNFDLIVDSPYIDMQAYMYNVNGGTTTKEERFLVFYERIEKKFKELATKVVTEDAFHTSCSIYIQKFKEAYLFETVQNMTLIMSDTGWDYRKTQHRVMKLKGMEAAQYYYNERKAVLDSLDEESSVRHFKFDADAYEDYMSDTDDDDEGILDYGLVEIDAVKGKMRRGNMVEVIGPPKGGKTTLTTFFVERALESGLNVAVWPLEGTKDEWDSLLAALMVRRDKRNNGMSLDKKNILEKKFNSQDEKAAVSAAMLSMASNANRGRLSFIDGACYVETMEDVMKYHYDNVNKFDVIVVDSPVNVLSLSNKPKNERISECYMSLKAFVSKKMKVKALCLCTAQIKQTVIDYIRAHPNEELDVTAGGESAETIRTPDEVIGVFSTKHERELNRMKIYSVASRHSRDFPTFFAHCELGCGYFESKPELNM